MHSIIQIQRYIAIILQLYMFTKYSVVSAGLLKLMHYDAHASMLFFRVKFNSCIVYIHMQLQYF